MGQSMGSEWARRALISFAVAVAAIPLIPGPRADTGSTRRAGAPRSSKRSTPPTRDRGSSRSSGAALNKADGSALFAADGLARYGYLANPKSTANPWGLPVGFMVANDIAAYGGRPTLAMNCAACHTREITIEGRPVRIDGGPAIADFTAS